MKQAKQKLKQAQHIAVLTGAGISAESGIPTFRGEEGLWRNYRPEELATPLAYASNPELVWEWYQMRFHTVTKAQPNDAHYLLSRLEQKTPLTLVTQNVDDLHKRAGSSNVLELHGNITVSRCESCGYLDKLEDNFSIPPECSKCRNRARPNVVWFGEALPQELFYDAVNAFAKTDLALIIGTSALVEPAASLAGLAKQEGAFVININPQETPLSDIADLSLKTTASQGLKELLSPDCPS